MPANKTTTTKVVLAISDELFGSAVIDFAGHHNWQGAPEFYLLHAVESPSVMPVFVTSDVEQMTADEQNAARQLINRMAAKLHALLPAASIHQLIQMGCAKERILALCDEVGADALIMGSHGRRGLNRFLLGSVSSAVVSVAPCSVSVVHVSDKDQKAFEQAEFGLTEDDLPQSICSYDPAKPTNEPIS